MLWTTLSFIRWWVKIVDIIILFRWALPIADRFRPFVRFAATTLRFVVRALRYQRISPTTVYPNPNNGNFYLNIQLADYQEDASLRILDVLGRVLHQEFKSYLFFFLAHPIYSDELFYS